MPDLGWGSLLGFTDLLAQLLQLYFRGVIMKVKFKVLLPIFITCCGYLNGTTFDDVSSLYQLTLLDYPCRSWDEPRIAVVKKISLPFPKEYSQESNWGDKYYNALSGLPNKYLQWFVRKASSRKFNIKTRST